MLAAGIEQCTLVSSLAGQRVNYLIMLAEALDATSLEPGQGDAR
jgi:hypothetical protein